MTKFDFNQISIMKTPMAPLVKLDEDIDDTSVDITLYKGMIGSLLYLTASRPDIMFTTFLCARFQANPKETHHCSKDYNLGSLVTSTWISNKLKDKIIENLRIKLRQMQDLIMNKYSVKVGKIQCCRAKRKVIHADVQSRNTHY